MPKDLSPLDQMHNQTAWLIKAVLLYRRRHLGHQRAIVDMPYHLQRKRPTARELCFSAPFSPNPS